MDKHNNVPGNPQKAPKYTVISFGFIIAACALFIFVLLMGAVPKGAFLKIGLLMLSIISVLSGAYLFKKASVEDRLSGNIEDDPLENARSEFFQQAEDFVRSTVTGLGELLNIALESSDSSDKRLDEHRTSLKNIVTLNEIKEIERRLLAELGRMKESGENFRKELHKVKTRVSEQEEKIEEYKRTSQIDILTLLNNRASFDKKMLEELDRIVRYGSDCALIILDLDDFKKINDTHGHLAGDRILRGVAKVIKKNTRISDFLARYGGDEFAVILPQTNLVKAVKVAEKIRCSLEGVAFRLEDARLKITASLGVAEFNAGKTVEDIIEVADQALYLAKSENRNRTRTEKDLPS